MMLTGRRFGLILALSFCMPVVAGKISSASGSLVHRYRGVDLQSPCLRVVTNVRTLSACVLWCHQHPSCRAGSYHNTRLTCCLSDVMAYQRNASYVEDDDSWYFQPAIGQCSSLSLSVCLSVCLSVSHLLSCPSSLRFIHPHPVYPFLSFHWLRSKDAQLNKTHSIN